MIEEFGRQRESGSIETTEFLRTPKAADSFETPKTAESFMSFLVGTAEVEEEGTDFELHEG